MSLDLFHSRDITRYSPEVVVGVKGLEKENEVKDMTIKSTVLNG